MKHANTDVGLIVMMVTLIVCVRNGSKSNTETREKEDKTKTTIREKEEEGKKYKKENIQQQKHWGWWKVGNRETDNSKERNCEREKSNNERWKDMKKKAITT